MTENPTPTPDPTPNPSPGPTSTSEVVPGVAPDPAAGPCDDRTNGARRGSRGRRAIAVGAGALALALAGVGTGVALGNDPADEAAAVAEAPATEAPVTEVTVAAATTSTSAATDADGTATHEGHDASDDTETAEVECDLPVADHSGTTDHGHTLHDATEGRAVTEADCDAAEAFYDEVVAAAGARFADVAAAEEAGYVISRQSADSPNPVDHYRLVGGNDAELDPYLPEGLVYRTDPDSGEAVLIGVVFMEVGDDLAQPGGPLTVWHDHHDTESCMELVPDCDPETDGDNAPRMLHVWFFDGVVDVFAHDYPGAVGETARGLRQ